MRFAGLILLFLFSINSVAQGLLFVKGHYQGNNLYVQNPETDTQGEYCMDSVYLNGRLIRTYVELNAFEISLDTLLRPNEDTVELRIFHKPACKPKILNPHIYPKSKYTVDSISLDQAGLLYFRIHGSGFIECHVEQYRWNKWVKVEEVNAVRLPFDTLINVNRKIHSGRNQFRVSVVEYTGRRKPSKAVYFEDEGPKEDAQVDRELQQIVFNQYTQYEVYDAYGNIVLRGEGKEVDVGRLKKGIYYLNFGNQNVKFKNKPAKK